MLAKAKVLFLLLALSIVVVFPRVEAEEAEFFMQTTWEKTEKSADSCINAAEDVLKHFKFEDGLGTVKDRAWGDKVENGRKAYKAIIRCEPSIKAVFFIVGGYDREETNKHANNFKRRFE